MIKNIMLLSFTVIILLFFGLRSKEINISNNYLWSASESGLQFNENSFSYVEKLNIESSTKNDLSIELVIKPEFFNRPRFSLILQIYNTSNDKQINIGQWKESLVILNTDDFSNKRREPKIYTSPLSNNKNHHIFITSDAEGTGYYLNGVLIKHNSDLKMSFSDFQTKSHLILGNNINGTNPWRGHISALAIYNSFSMDERITSHYSHWKKTERLQSDTDTPPQLQYTFDESGGSTVIDKSGRDNHLILPEEFLVLKKNILQFPDFKSSNRKDMKIDMILNYFGFIPLGIILFITLNTMRLLSLKKVLFFLFIVSFSLSLFIELMQISMIGRHSSMLDLLLNTSGGYTGGMFMYYLTGKREKYK